MTATRQMLKSERIKLAKLFDEFAEAWGATRTAEPSPFHRGEASATWAFTTTLGKYTANAIEGSIFGRFTEPERAAKSIWHLNPISGKWNFHPGRVTAAEAFDEFARSISQFRADRFFLRMYRTGQTHPAALSTWRGEDRADLERIGRLNSSEDAYCILTDTEVGESARI